MITDPRNKLVTNRLRAMAARNPNRIKGALFQEAQNDMTASKKIVPVEFGVLRGSGIVEELMGLGRRIAFMLRYGGAAGAYAIPVHEDPDARHTNGVWKYLESIVNASRSTMLGRLAKRLRVENW